MSQSATYHINYLLQSKTEFERQSIRLVEDGPFQIVVLFQQVIDEPPFVWTTIHTWKEKVNIL